MYNIIEQIVIFLDIFIFSPCKCEGRNTSSLSYIFYLSRIFEIFSSESPYIFDSCHII